MLFKRSGKFVQTFDLIDEPEVKIITFGTIEYGPKRRFGRDLRSARAAIPYEYRYCRDL